MLPRSHRKQAEGRFQLFVPLLLLIAPMIAADTAFAKWWPQFQAAVAGRNANAVAKGVHFPLNWENGQIREIKTEADLLIHFDVYFTGEIRKIIATRTPERLPNGIYIITWKARGNEYSLYFKPEASGRFALDGLSEGPT